MNVIHVFKNGETEKESNKIKVPLNEYTKAAYKLILENKKGKNIKCR